MLILNRLKVIFIHLEKCGGTSVEVALDNYASWNDIILGSTTFGESVQGAYRNRFGLWKHSTAPEVQSVVGDHVWGQYFKFATVRNPYSLTASLYNYAATQVEHRVLHGDSFVGHTRSDIKDFIDSGEFPNVWPWNWLPVRAYIASRKLNSQFSEFIRSPFLLQDQAFSPQSSRLSDFNKKSLLVDEAIQVEQLDSEWHSLLDRIGVPYCILHRLNETPEEYRTPLRVLFSNQDDIEFVKNRFSDDFEAFGYSSKFT